MNTAAVRAGFRRDRTQRIAALLAWAITLVVSLIAIWPAWRWWTSALALAPRGDVLIDRVDLVILKELVQFDRGSTFGMVYAALAGGLVAALVLNPLLAGGVVGLLTGAAAGPTTSRRFFDAGVRFYGRFLRALIYAGAAGLVVLGIIAGLGTLAADALAERGLERAFLAAHALRLAALGLAAAFFAAVLDLARIRIATSDSRHVLVACFDALRLALRRPGALLQIGAVFIALLAAVTALVLALRANLPGGGWFWLAAAVLLQQALAYARMRLRVSAIAALAALAQPAAVAASPAVIDARFAEYDLDDDVVDAAR